METAKAEVKDCNNCARHVQAGKSECAGKSLHTTTDGVQWTRKTWQQICLESKDLSYWLPKK